MAPTEQQHTHPGLDEPIREAFLQAQRAEATESRIYARLAKMVRGDDNTRTLQEIGADESRHYRTLKGLTGQDVPADHWKVRLYVVMAWVFGVTFAVRLMERGEEAAQVNYRQYADRFEELAGMQADEHQHEERLLDMLDEERLRYASSMVLGLNDALVELTGAIAGLTLALRNTDLIAMVGLITGISAALSMAASEYLSTKQDNDSRKKPVKAAIYTGIAYVGGVVVLVVPFLLVGSAALALVWSLVNALVLIGLFTFYISIARGESFRRNYTEMATISMGVALISFVLGYGVRAWLGVDV